MTKALGTCGRCGLLLATSVLIAGCASQRTGPLRRPALVLTAETPAADSRDTAAFTRTAQLLDANGSINADAQPLEKVLDTIAQGSHVTLWVNWTALEASGVDRPTPVTLHLKDVPWRSALRLALAGTNTMFVDLLKSTSLLVTISAAELMTRGQLITSETFRPLEVYLVISALYFALCYPLSQALLWLETLIRKGVPLGWTRRRRLNLARRLIAKGGHHAG